MSSDISHLLSKVKMGNYIGRPRRPNTQGTRDKEQQLLNVTEPLIPNLQGLKISASPEQGTLSSRKRSASTLPDSSSAKCKKQNALNTYEHSIPVSGTVILKTFNSTSQVLGRGVPTFLKKWHPIPK